MNAEDRGIRRYQLILGIIFAVACIGYLIVVHVYGITTEVSKGYLPYANQLADGNIPAMEYPQLALVFMAIPRIFSSTDFGYTTAFVAEVFVFFMIGLIVVGKLAKRYNQSQRKAMLIYTILMLLMLEFVVDRYDIFPAVLTLISFYFLVTKQYVWAFVMLSIATMTKVYPAVLFPIYLIPFVINRDWLNALKGAGAFIIIAILIILPFLLLNSDVAFHFISYNMDRPIQIESTAASAIAFASTIGLTSFGIQSSLDYRSFGSDNALGPWADSVMPYLTPLILVILILIYAAYAYMLVKVRKEGKDNENIRMILLGGASLLAIMAFMIFGKVFSSQYLVWAIPFVGFLLMTSIDYKERRYIFILSVIAIILSQLNFAVNIGICGGGTGITDGGMMIILARNIVMLILFAYVIKTCVERVGKWPLRRTHVSEE